MPQTCDYSDTDYKTTFWDGGARAYEDLSERIAIQKLLPAKGKTLLDLGAGFGRLTNEYVDRFGDIVLFDYAKNLLNQAEQEWYIKQHKTHLRFVQGDARKLPFVDGAFDVIVSVRLLHHILEIDEVFAEVKRVLRPGGCAIIEFANKKNAKEILNALLRRPNSQPYSWEPYRRGDGIFYNFHPAFISEQLERVGLKIEQTLSVSNFRIGLAKKYLRLEKLLEWEDRLQKPLAALDFGPSIFLKITHI